MLAFGVFLALTIKWAERKSVKKVESLFLHYCSLRFDYMIGYLLRALEKFPQIYFIMTLE